MLSLSPADRKGMLCTYSVCSAGQTHNTQVHIIKPSPHVNIVQSKYIINERRKWGMYSQFLQIGEVLEDICWELSDVVHAQVTVETR